jgi:hypothetical protein
MNNKHKFLPILFAIIAAALYALNAPLSKMLLASLPAAFTAGFLYLGAGTGMSAVNIIIGIFYRYNDRRQPNSIAAIFYMSY